MAVTINDIKTRLPEFAGTATATLTLALAEAERRINPTQWGVSKADDATVYLTGHLLALGCKQGDSPAGAVTSERVGDVQVSYALPGAFSQSALASTAYGRRYLELLALIFPTRCA